MDAIGLYFVIGLVAAFGWIAWSAFKRPFRALSDSLGDKISEATLTFAIFFAVIIVWGLGLVFVPLYGMFRFLVWVSGSDDPRKRKNESY